LRRGIEPQWPELSCWHLEAVRVKSFRRVFGCLMFRAPVRWESLGFVHGGMACELAFRVVAGCDAQNNDFVEHCTSLPSVERKFVVLAVCW